MRAELARGRRELGARMAIAVARVGHVAAVAVRKAEIHAGARRVVELVGRHVVAHVVCAVVGEPELLRARVPVEADAVADAARVDLALAARGEAADRAVFILRLAYVAGGADADVEQAVRPEPDRLVAVMRMVRQIAGDDRRLGRILQVALDRVVARDAADLRDVERAVAEGDAVRRIQPARDHARGAAARRHGIDISLAAADEERAAAAERERSRAGHVLGVDADAKPGRQLDLVEARRGKGARGGERADERSEAKHGAIILQRSVRGRAVAQASHPGSSA